MFNAIFSLENRFHYWLDHKRKRGTFELRGGFIIRRSGEGDCDIIHTSDIESWFDYDDAWIAAVPIALRDGRTVVWTDPYFELTKILENVAPGKKVSA